MKKFIEVSVLLVIMLVGCQNKEQLTLVGTPIYDSEIVRNITDDIDTQYINDFFMTFKYGEGGYHYTFLQDSTLTDGSILRVFHTNLEMNTNNHQEYDSEILDGNSLRPLQKNFGDQTEVFFDYSDSESIRVQAIVNEDTTNFGFKTKEFLFVVNGPGSYYLPQGLPLGVGYRTEFLGLENSYSTRKGLDTLRYSLEVLNTEMIQFNSEAIECFVVEMKSMDVNRGFYSKVWARKSRPHIPIQSIFTLNRRQDSLTEEMIGRPWRIFEAQK